MAVIYSNFRSTAGRSSLASVNWVLEKVGPRSEATIDRLKHVLRPPVDLVWGIQVIGAAIRSVTEFGKCLVSPTENYQRIAADLTALSKEVAGLNVQVEINELNDPLYRRLLDYPAWALCIALHSSDDSEDILIAAGAEISMCLDKNKPFRKDVANELRREVDKRFAKKSANPTSGFKRENIEKLKQSAIALFDSGSSERSIDGLTDCNSFQHLAIRYLRRNQTYARPNHRRGVLDHRCQSERQLLHSAAVLRQKAEQGDNDATTTMLAFCSGLSPSLASRVPLIASAPADWFMVLEAEKGLLKVNIEPLFEDSASPPVSSAAAHLPANKIIVKPLPKFLAEEITARFAGMPNAKNFGELFPCDLHKKEKSIIEGDEGGIAASVARFLNSAAPFAIKLGIDRFAVSCVTNDFSVVPGAKPYYAQIEREEIWCASSILFDRLGWGEPADYEPGLAAGSRISPTREALASVFSWMREEIIRYRPGKRYRLESLIEFHNTYTKYCMSLLILCIASRCVKEFKFVASSLLSGGAYIPIFDKKCGQFPGQMPVAVSSALKKQMKYFRAHCMAIDRRLEKLGISKNSRARIYLANVDSSSTTVMFKLFGGKLEILPIGTSDLVKWWPESLRFLGNYSRAFWQIEFRKAGIKSSVIDLFVRHQLLGMESHTSTNHLVLEECFIRLCAVQEQVFHEIEISPVPGLARK